MYKKRKKKKKKRKENEKYSESVCVFCIFFMYVIESKKMNLIFLIYMHKYLKDR